MFCNIVEMWDLICFKLYVQLALMSIICIYIHSGVHFQVFRTDLHEFIYSVIMLNAYILQFLKKNLARNVFHLRYFCIFYLKSTLKLLIWSNYLQVYVDIVSFCSKYRKDLFSRRQINWPDEDKRSKIISLDPTMVCFL